MTNRFSLTTSAFHKDVQHILSIVQYQIVQMNGPGSSAVWKVVQSDQVSGSSSVSLMRKIEKRDTR